MFGWVGKLAAKLHRLCCIVCRLKCIVARGEVGTFVFSLALVTTDKCVDWITLTRGTIWRAKSGTSSFQIAVLLKWHSLLLVLWHYCTAVVT
jgi:hypothetical protein